MDEEVPRMEKNVNGLILYQTIISFTLLQLVSAGLFLTWALGYLQIINDRKRPGINIKEL